MDIRETKVFLFTFKTDQGDVQFPLRAETKEEAIAQMQKTFLRMQSELAMDAPKVSEKLGAVKSNEDVGTNNSPISLSNIPPEVLELRIDTLLKDMGAGELRGKAKADTVKLWTGHEFKEQNYTAIVTELELLRTGQKEVPTKKK